MNIKKMIFEAAPKPSDAINAMIQGLKYHKKHGFSVDMHEYMTIGIKSNTCYGCAATAALTHIFKRRINSKKSIDFMLDRACGIRASGEHGNEHEEDIGVIDKFDRLDLLVPITPKVEKNMPNLYDLYDFETSLEMFRTGVINYLFRYYNYRKIPLKPNRKRWCLRTENWKEELPKVEEYRDQLIAAGY